MKTFTELQEGVYDPNILKKTFFLAGRSGSGKSYVVKRTTGGLGMKIVNSDVQFEKKLKDAGLSTDLRELDPTTRDTIRSSKEQKRLPRNKKQTTLRVDLDLS